MRKILAVFYGLLFSLFFIDFCLASAAKINFKLDEGDKIISPASISFVGVELQLAGKTLSDAYKIIASQQNFIGKKAQEEMDQREKSDVEWFPRDYENSMNELMDLSTLKATAPQEYVGKTVAEIALMLKGFAENISNGIIDTNIQPKEMHQPIKNQIKILNKPQLKKDVNNFFSKPLQPVRKISPLTGGLSSLAAPKQVKMQSESETAGEWLFVEKSVYDNLVSSKAFPATIIYADGKKIGPQSKAILDQSVHNKKSYPEYLQALSGAVKPAAIQLSDEKISAPTEIKISGVDTNIQGKNIKDVYPLVKADVRVVGSLKSSLKPDAVKQNFLALCLEGDYCSVQVAKINHTIGLFNQQVKKYAKPVTFGDGWLLKKNEYKGISPSVTCAPDITFTKKNPTNEDKNQLAQALLESKENPTDSLVNDTTYAQLLTKVTALHLPKKTDAEKESAVRLIEAMFLTNTGNWAKNIDNLKAAFSPRLVKDGKYQLVPITILYREGSDEFELAKKSDIAKLIDSVEPSSIIPSMNNKVEGPEKTVIDLYPAPLDAFNAAWNSLYVLDASMQKYKFIKNGASKELVDADNVPAVKDALLKAFAGYEFGTTITIPESKGTAVAKDAGTLSDDLVKAMYDYATKNKIEIKYLNIPKIVNGVTLPAGWVSASSQGLQNPSGVIISSSDIAKAVKALGAKTSSDDSSSGAVTEAQYIQLAKHVKGPLEPGDDQMIVAMKSGKSYKEYKEILAGGAAPVAQAGISKEAYDKMLKLAQDAQKKKKLPAPSLVMALTVSDPNKTYTTLGLPATEEYKDLLFPALGAGKSYDDFIASPEYQTYLKDNPVGPLVVAAPVVVESSPVATSTPTAIVSSIGLVDEAKYQALAKSVKMRSLDEAGLTNLCLNQTSGIPDYKNISKDKKDPLIKSLLAKQSYEDYIHSLSGSSVQIIAAVPTVDTKFEKFEQLIEKSKDYSRQLLGLAHQKKHLDQAKAA